MSKFQRAERKRAKIKVAITGPSGAGKTYSALTMATGLGQKIAVIDTENDSASLYSDRFEFDTLVISPPYTIQKYLDAIGAAQEEGYDVLIIDSITHAWAGEGGLLSKKEALDARGGNSFSNWAGITKEHEAFKANLLVSDIHLICTMRSKQDYVLDAGDKGKTTPRKVGLAPIQREGMEYEFTTVFDIAMDHNASTSKDRTGLFDGVTAKITKDTGKRLQQWLNGAKVDAPVRTPAPANVSELDGNFRKASEQELRRLFSTKNSVGMPDEMLRNMLTEFGAESSRDLSSADCEELIERVKGWQQASTTA
jgi:hypothetical protein